MSQVTDRVLGKDCNTITVDQIRDTMMDFRINMVWTSCKDNTSSACFFQISKCLFTFFLHIFTCLCQFFPCCMCCCLYFFCRNILKHLYQTVCKNCLCGKCKERIHKGDLRVTKFIHVIFDIFRIGGNDRTVIMVYCIRKFVSLIRDTWVENKFYTFLQ